MKNRILELAMLKGIKTVDEYSSLLGIDEARAKLILESKTELSEPEICKNCEFFHVSRLYLLCEVDIDN